MPIPVAALPLLKYVILYLAICIIIGVLGRRRKLGAWGYFFGSIVLTPIIGLLLLLASETSDAHSSSK